MLRGLFCLFSSVSDLAAEASSLAYALLAFTPVDVSPPTLPLI